MIALILLCKSSAAVAVLACIIGLLCCFIVTAIYMWQLHHIGWTSGNKLCNVLEKITDTCCWTGAITGTIALIIKFALGI
jgi:hypothetical protein